MQYDPGNMSIVPTFLIFFQLMAGAAAETLHLMPGGELGLSHARGGEAPGLLLGARLGVYEIEDYKGIPLKARGVGVQLLTDTRRARYRIGLSAQAWELIVGAELGLVGELHEGTVRPGFQAAVQPTLAGLASVVLRLVHIPAADLPWRHELVLQVQWPTWH